MALWSKTIAIAGQDPNDSTRWRLSFTQRFAAGAQEIKLVELSGAPNFLYEVVPASPVLTGSTPGMASYLLEFTVNTPFTLKVQALGQTSANDVQREQIPDGFEMRVLGFTSEPGGFVRPLNQCLILQDPA